jgi:hypothetical protein
MPEDPIATILRALCQDRGNTWTRPALPAEEGKRDA